MRKLLTTIVLLIFINNYAQEIPNVELENNDGGITSTETILQTTEKPIIMTFWATWCIPCLTELSSINENYESWKEKYQFELYAISVDDDRTVKKVPTIVAGKGWPYKILLDTNQDFKRKLNINSIPYLIVVKDGKIIYKKTGFVKGDELKIEKVIAENQ